MFTFSVWLCIAAVFGVSWATIPVKEVNFSIFHDHSTNWEASLYDTMNDVQDLTMPNRIDYTATVASLIPIVGNFFSLVPMIRDLLDDDSIWKRNFLRIIKSEMVREIATNDIRTLESTMESIEEDARYLNDTSLNDASRNSYILIIQHDVSKMIKFFARHDSLFKKYSLLASPIVIELALMIASFIPLANNPHITCSMRDVLIEYRPRAVEARLDKLSVDEKEYLRKGTMPELMAAVRTSPNNTLPDILKCEASKHSGFKRELTDAYGDVIYMDSLHNEYLKCIEGYARVVRDRVEDMFPIGLMNRLCDNRAPGELTGYGWLTIKIKNLFVHSTATLGVFCDYFIHRECDPFVVIFIDEVEAWRSPTRYDVLHVNMDETFVSGKILKTSKIRIEVRDEDSSKSELIQDTGANGVVEDVSSFLNNGFRRCVRGYNHIETAAYWQDEWKYPHTPELHAPKITV